MVLAALGMADECVTRTDVHQHRARHLAGPRAPGVFADVLRTELQPAFAITPDQLGQVRQRRQHHPLDPGRRRGGRDRVQQAGGETAVAMQFPVPRDDASAHSPLRCAKARILARAVAAGADRMPFRHRAGCAATSA
jgi:hypothetical protein